MAERLYSPQQVAELLGVTPDTIHGWVRRGWLGSERSPVRQGDLVIGEMAVARFLKNQGIDIEELFARSVMGAGAARPSGAGAEEVGAPELHDKGGMPTACPPSGGPPLRGRVSGEGENMPGERRAGHAIPRNSALPESPGTPEAIPAGAVGQVLDAVLKDALKRGATAVHFDARPDGLTLRLRVGGRLHEKPRFKPRLPKGMRTSLPALCKRLGGLRPGETARPQSGGFKVRMEGQDRHFRITSCPTPAGESIVIVLDGREAAPAIDKLGFSEEDLAALRRMLAEPAGLVLVTAPPRSIGPRLLAALAIDTTAGTGNGEQGTGKTAAVPVPGSRFPVPAVAVRRVAVIARRMDFDVPGALHVRPDAEVMPPAAAIRAAADHDTDVILVDNLRDCAAVSAALDAAAERLVLAGLAVRGEGIDPTLLADAGADPLALAQSLLGIVSAVPLRRICDACRTSAVADGGLLRRMALDGEDEALRVWRGSGCAACNETGYAGETTATAVLAADEELARLLRRSAGRQAIGEFICRAGARTLRDAVIEKVLAGETTLEEAVRALHA